MLLSMEAYLQVRESIGSQLKVAGEKPGLTRVSQVNIEREVLLRTLCSALTVMFSTGTKLTQAKKFNDPDDPCKILVATDAIGMGLNL